MSGKLDKAKIAALPQTSAAWQLEYRKMDMPLFVASQQAKKLHLLILLDNSNEAPIGLLTFNRAPKLQEVAALLEQAMLAPQNRENKPARPRQINFTSLSWLRSLQADLWAADIDARAAPPSPIVDAILLEIEATFKDGEIGKNAPQFLGIEGANPDIVGDFYLAAAQFMQHSTHEKFGVTSFLHAAENTEEWFILLLPQLSSEKPEADTVMLIFPTWENLTAFLKINPESQEPVHSQGMITVMFVSKEEAFLEETRAAAEYHWPMVKPNIYPQIFYVDNDYPYYATLPIMQLVTALLRGITKLAERVSFVHPGLILEPFSTEIATQGGGKSFQFTFSYPPGEMPPFLNELIEAVVHEYYQDEQDPLINTPSLQQAQEKAEAAAKLEDKAQAMALAQQALAIDRDHPLPYLILGRYTEHPSKQKKWIEEGLDAMRRLFERAGDDAAGQYLDNAMAYNTGGVHWELLDAQAAIALEENDPATAAANYRLMLDLDGDDEDGIRFDLLELYLRLGENRSALELLVDYENEFGIGEYYLLALTLFRLQGNSTTARQVLRFAKKNVPEIAEYLMGSIPLSLSPQMAPPAAPPRPAPPDKDQPANDEGEENDSESMLKEAIIEFTRQFFVAWYTTPGAIAWMKKPVK